MTNLISQQDGAPARYHYYYVKGHLKHMDWTKWFHGAPYPFSKLDVNTFLIEMYLKRKKIDDTIRNTLTIKFINQ